MTSQNFSAVTEIMSNTQLSHLYLCSTLYNTDCFKAALQW